MLINPEIVKRGDKEEIGQEGCLSLPGRYGDVPRASWVTVDYTDLDGKQRRIRKAAGLLGRSLHHELDHLDGVLLLDHLEADQRKMAKKQVREMMMGERGPDELPDRSRKRLGSDALFGGSR